MTQLSRPPLLYTLAEGRAFLELGLCLQSLPILRSAPRGDGHPVLVFPGFMAGNSSTGLLRWFLRDLGYRAEGWCLGRNLGHVVFANSLNRQIARVFEACGEKISIVGWSLGGVFAREIARQNPDRVRQVITLGSPFAAGPSGTSVGWLYSLVTGRTVEADEVERLRPAPAVPTTAIYSRTDGIVNWRGCMEEDSGCHENIQVNGSHCGLGHNPAVLLAIADRLAQDPAHWRPFEPTPLQAVLYPEHRTRMTHTVRAVTRRLIQPFFGPRR